MAASLGSLGDIPSLEGQVIWVAAGLLDITVDLDASPYDTELNQGTNIELVVELAKRRPERIYLSGRRGGGCEAFLEHIELRAPHCEIVLVECDLTSLDSVEAAGRAFPWHYKGRLDLLICNGHVRPELPPGQSTDDGWEIQFGSNFLAHALLVHLLLPALKRTQIEHGTSTRVVLGTWTGFRSYDKQIAYGLVRKDHRGCFSPELSRVDPIRLYAQSKLALVHYAAEMGRLNPNTTFVSAHGGTTVTWESEALASSSVGGLRRAVQKTLIPGGIRNPAEGARTLLWVATCPKELLKQGGCYGPRPGQEDGNARRANADSREQLLYQFTWTYIAGRLRDLQR